MRVKIISDGTVLGTRVVDAETGEDLSQRITRVEWVADAPGNLVTARLTYFDAGQRGITEATGVPVEVEGEAVEEQGAESGE